MARQCSDKVDLIQRRTKRSLFFQVANSGFEVVVLVPDASVVESVAGGGIGLRINYSKSKVSRAEMIVVRHRE